VPEPDEREPRFWERWWWVYPVAFGSAGTYQLLTGATGGQWGDPSVGVPLCYGLAILGGWLAKSGWFDDMSG
jgi:hypothetical protein